MKFSDFVSDKSIQDDLKSDDKEGVIRELVDTLVAAGEIKTNNRNKIVSTWSSAVWPVTTKRAPSVRATSSRKA